jgi:hypothetical protein
VNSQAETHAQKESKNDKSNEDFTDTDAWKVEECFVEYRFSENELHRALSGI